MLLTTPEAGRVEWQKSLNAFVASLLLGAKIDPQDLPLAAIVRTNSSDIPDPGDWGFKVGWRTRDGGITPPEQGSKADECPVLPTGRLVCSRVQ